MVGGEDCAETAQLGEEVGVLAEVVDAVCVEDCDAVVGEALHQSWEELVHVLVPSQARADHPGVDGLAPVPHPLQPLLNHFFSCF